jgi:raffinose/stachyose/melibiose transport system substrate-binding protein
MKKVLSLALAAALVIAPIGLASSKTITASAASQKYAGVTLNVLTHWTNLTNSKGTGWLDKFGAKFKKETGATVKFEAITSYTTDVKTRLSSKNYGDVLDIPTGVAVADLPSFFSKLGNTNDKDIKKYYYNYMDGIKQKNGSYNTYGLSYGLSYTGAVYNKAALAKVGYSKFPTKLSDLYTLCGKLKAKGIVAVALNFKDKWPLSSFDAIPLSASHDGNWANTVYKTTNLFSANKPYGISLGILNKIVSNKWCESDLATTNWEQSKTDLGTGKDAMMFLGYWAVPQMQGAAKAAGKSKSDIGFAPIPTDNTGKLYSYASQDYMMGISKYSKHYALARQYLMEFIKSDFAASQGFAPIVKGQKSSDKTMNAFINSGLTAITGIAGTTGKEGSNMTDIGNDAGIDFWGGAYVQNVCTASQQGQYTAYINTLNSKWNASKKKLGF